MGVSRNVPSEYVIFWCVEAIPILLCFQGSAKLNFQRGWDDGAHILTIMNVSNRNSVEVNFKQVLILSTRLVSKVIFPMEGKIRRCMEKFEKKCIFIKYTCYDFS